MPFSPKLIRIARRLLIGLAIFITIIFFTVTIENWRGDRAWQRYAAEQTARGINLTDLPLPSTLPAATNFMKTPTLDRFLWEPSGSAAMREFYSQNKFPSQAVTPSFLWQRGRPLDYKSCIERYAEARTSQNSDFSAGTLLALQKPVEKTLEELRGAARERPESQLARKRAIDRINPFGTAFASFQFVRALVIAQSTHACAALVTEQSEVALYDTLAALKFSRGLAEAPDPMLVETMIGTVSISLALQPVWEGLQRRSWHDAQLTLLAQELARTDLVGSLDRSLQTERLAANAMLDQLSRRESPPADVAQFKVFTWFVFPVGWIQQNKVLLNQWSDHVRDTLSNRGSACFLEKLQHIDDFAEKIGGPSPYTMLVVAIMPAYQKVTSNVLQKQSFIHLALTACALERYSLANGSYPERLAELVPTYLDKVPLDIIDGQPLRYRRTENGKFLLYSIGLDGKDDGGKPNTSNEAGAAGDWIWPQLVTATPKSP